MHCRRVLEAYPLPHTPLSGISNPQSDPLPISKALRVQREKRILVFWFSSHWSAAVAAMTQNSIFATFFHFKVLSEINITAIPHWLLIKQLILKTIQTLDYWIYQSLSKRQWKNWIKCFWVATNSSTWNLDLPPCITYGFHGCEGYVGSCRHKWNVNCRAVSRWKLEICTLYPHLSQNTKAQPDTGRPEGKLPDLHKTTRCILQGQRC